MKIKSKILGWAAKHKMKTLKWLACGLMLPGGFFTPMAWAQTISLSSTNIASLASLSNEELSSLVNTLDATPTIPMESLPLGGRVGNFWSLQNPLWPPLPFDTSGADVWVLSDGGYLLNDADFSYAAAAHTMGGLRRGAQAMDGLTPPGPGDYGTNDYPDDFTNSYGYTFDTNQLWLEVTNVSGGLAYLNLHNATNQVYAIWSTTNLPLNWQVEMELWPTDTNCMPFTVPTFDRQNLFLRAEDWTGVTHGGNTTPDWWFWKYFGTTALTDTNLDGFGYSLRFDYTNNADPTPILFSLQFPGEEAYTNNVNGTIKLSGGTPFYIAVLVNDTNQADAVWQPYGGTNLAVSLNNGVGVYAVSVGLRGLPQNAQPTWQGTEVTLLPSAPPVFTITNPASTTVSVPMIQLQGFVSQTLNTLTYDVSNAVGVITNQTGYWNPAFFNTNVLDFVTNAFQCYDIALTNGVNVITLHATDLAGNTVTTNFSYTLDYSGKTNPPVLALVWPQPNLAIGGSNFTLRAQLDDATATVTATINSNTVAGLVERSGAVWFNNLPLNTGTNLVTITATDAAGNASVTNFNVVGNDVGLVIDPLTSDQMNQSSVTVTGSIGDPADDCVWVNGVQAYYTDDEGDWEADAVPVNPLGTATLNVQVYVGDPVLIASQTVAQAQPATIRLMSYRIHSQLDATWYHYCGGPAPQMTDEVENWLYQSGGTHSYVGSGIDGDCEAYHFNNVSSLASGYPGPAVAWESRNTTEQVYYPPVWLYNSYPAGWIYNAAYELGSSSEAVRARVMIQPGGPAAAGQAVLYLVQAQVTNEDNGLQLLAGAVSFLNQMAGTLEDVTNSDGSIWTQALVSAPPGAQVEVTPQAAGNYSYMGMKLSKLVYFSVDPSGMPASYFSARSVQSLLQSELSSNVFDSLPAGQSVQVKVHIDSSYGGTLGWDSSKQSYVNRVDWATLSGIPASRDYKGLIQIDPSTVDTYASARGTSPTAQTWVNIFAHEGIWGNAGGNHDCVFFCTDGDISGGSIFSSAFLFAPYIVTPSSRATLRSEFGF
jgi:hypothetical protein